MDMEQNKNCEHCGSEIRAATRRRKYCSNACRQASYRNGGTTLYSYRNTRAQTGSQPASDGLKPYIYPERVIDPHIGSNPDGSTTGVIRGDYHLDYYPDGQPKLPKCLDRRK